MAGRWQAGAVAAAEVSREDSFLLVGDATCDSWVELSIHDFPMPF